MAAISDEDRLSAYRNAVNAAANYQARSSAYQQRMKDLDEDPYLSEADKIRLRQEAADSFYSPSQEEARATLGLGAEFGEIAAGYKGEQERATIGKGGEEQRKLAEQAQIFKQLDEERDYRQAQRAYRF